MAKTGNCGARSDPTTERPTYNSAATHKARAPRSNTASSRNRRPKRVIWWMKLGAEATPGPGYSADDAVFDTVATLIAAS